MATREQRAHGIARRSREQFYDHLVLALHYADKMDVYPHPGPVVDREAYTLRALADILPKVIAVRVAEIEQAAS